MPDYDVHDICEACDHELYDIQQAEIQQEISHAEAEAYEHYCWEQSQIHEG